MEAICYPKLWALTELHGVTFQITSDPAFHTIVLARELLNGSVSGLAIKRQMG
jgi:hypothetical protein